MLPSDAEWLTPLTTDVRSTSHHHPSMVHEFHGTHDRLRTCLSPRRAVNHLCRSRMHSHLMFSVARISSPTGSGPAAVAPFSRIECNEARPVALDKLDEVMGQPSSTSTSTLLRCGAVAVLHIEPQARDQGRHVKGTYHGSGFSACAPLCAPPSCPECARSRAQKCAHR